MRILLLSLLVLSASCGKKDNSFNSQKANAVTQKSFVTIYHKDGESAFRSKLLNSIVEETFPSAEKKGVLKANEELDNSGLTAYELSNYKEKEASLAKVIVSYADRTEIYFLPEGIDLRKIAASLDLRPIDSSNFKILKHPYYKTGRGQTFYLIDSSYEELMKNDQKYFSTQNDYKDQYFSKTLKFEAHKKVELLVTFTPFLQKMEVVTMNGRSGKCTKDMVEAGVSCGCTYKTHAASGSYDNYNGFSLEELGFNVIVNGKMIPLSALSAKKVKDNYFETELKEEDLSKDGEIEIAPTASKTVVKNVTAFESEGQCLSDNRSTISLASMVHFSVVVKISGRGELLRKISL